MSTTVPTEDPPVIDLIAADGPPPPSSPPPALRREGRARPAAAAIAYGALGFVMLGLIWQVASWTSDGLPGPAATVDTVVSELRNAFVADGPAGQGIGLQLLDSLTRVFQGFLLAALLGIPLGLAMGRSRRLHHVFNPVVQLLRPVSPLAWFPIWLTILVRSEPAAVWVIFMASVWPVVLNTAAGASSVPSYQQDVARVFRFSRSTRLRQIVLPHALPSIITGLRLSMGVAWMVIVAAEMLSAASGIGFYVWQSYNGAGLTHVITAVLLIGAVGVGLDLAFGVLARLVTHQEVRS